MFYKAALFALFVLCVHHVPGEPLMCNTCNSDVNSACKPDSDPGIMMSCEPKIVNGTWEWLKIPMSKFGGFFKGNSELTFICYKIVIENGKEKRVARGCNLAKSEKYEFCTEVQKSITGSSKLVTCETCDSEGCNVSSDLAPSAVHLLVLFVLTVAVSLS